MCAASPSSCRNISARAHGQACTPWTRSVLLLCGTCRSVAPYAATLGRSGLARGRRAHQSGCRPVGRLVYQHHWRHLRAHQRRDSALGGVRVERGPRTVRPTPHLSRGTSPPTRRPTSRAGWCRSAGGVAFQSRPCTIRGRSRTAGRPRLRRRRSLRRCTPKRT
jgi:hypothetical protein